MSHAPDARQPRRERPAGTPHKAGDRAERRQHWRPPEQLELFEQRQLELALFDTGA